MRLALLALFSVASLSGADSDFNGRWDIRVPQEPRNRAWWLEIAGAGTPSLKGRFVGFPGGNMDPIQTLSIEDGILHFAFDRQTPKNKVHIDYSAKFADGKLQGEMHQGKTTLEWIGVPAPVIDEHDDGSWKPGKPIALFNGKDLSGFHGQVPGKPLGWTVENGALSNTPAANNLVTGGRFWNFTLHVEFKVSEDTNSGIGLRGRYEVQILDDYGKPAEIHGNGALYSRILPTRNASKPAGEWQTFDIRLIGRDVTVVLNGHKVIDRKTIEGLTAIAMDPDEAAPGPLIIQGDHRHVDIRNILLTPLSRK